MTADVVRFEVRGIPIQQGSARAFIVGRGGPKQRAVVTHDSRRDLGAWRHLVADVAQGHAPQAPWEDPVSVTLAFSLPRPKSEPTHRGRGRNRHPVRTWPRRRPDLDKLIRAVIDSLTGVVFVDDAQVVRISASKEWGVPGVAVEVCRVVEEE